MSDPEAEYLAAKEAFLAAHERLKVAKAVMKPIWEAREAAKLQAHLDMLIKAQEAYI